MRVIGSFSKGLRMLEWLAGHEGVRLVEIAEAFKLPSSNASLFLNSLQEEGWVRRGADDGRYYLAGKLAKLALQAGDEHSRALLSVAQPELERLARHFDENVLLAVLTADTLSFIARIQSRRSVQVVNTAASYPPHATAGGKAILAFLPDAERQAYLEHANYKRSTPHTVASRVGLEAELEAVREQGFAMNRGEYEPDVLAVGAPVFEGARAIAALVVQFPRARVSVEELEAKAAPVVEAARRVSKALG